MNNEHNHQKKIAAINDFTGFGRCSLTVALPIISVMGVQCCPVPTAVFSNHTGFESFYMEDYSGRIGSYIDEWKKLGLKFEGICSGFLGSAEQADMVEGFIREFSLPGTVVLVDPVMGDYGRFYPTCTDSLCGKMRELVKLADIITPNITEACLLTGTRYKERWTFRELEDLAAGLMEMGPGKIVITGIPLRTYLGNFCSEEGRESHLFRTLKIGNSRSGTGDIFAAILAADAVNGTDFRTSVHKASRFVKECLLRSARKGIPLTDGVCFEELLGQLR